MSLKFNSIYQTLPDVHTVQTTSKLYVYKFMLIAVSVVFTSLTVYIQRKNCHQSLNCFCQSKERREVRNLHNKSNNNNKRIIIIQSDDDDNNEEEEEETYKVEYQKKRKNLNLVVVGG